MGLAGKVTGVASKYASKYVSKQAAKKAAKQAAKAASLGASSVLTNVASEYINDKRHETAATAPVAPASKARRTKEGGDPTDHKDHLSLLDVARENGLPCHAKAYIVDTVDGVRKAYRVHIHITREVDLGVIAIDESVLMEGDAQEFLHGLMN